MQKWCGGNGHHSRNSIISNANCLNESTEPGRTGACIRAPGWPGSTTCLVALNDRHLFSSVTGGWTFEIKLFPACLLWRLLGRNPPCLCPASGACCPLLVLLAWAASLQAQPLSLLSPLPSTCLFPSFPSLKGIAVPGVEPALSQCDLIISWLPLQILYFKIRSYLEILERHWPPQYRPQLSTSLDHLLLLDSQVSVFLSLLLFNILKSNVPIPVVLFSYALAITYLW